MQEGPHSPRAKRPRFGNSQKTFEASLRNEACPYLDTINRSALDFDLPPICSVTLVSHNVYACLICGRFFHGRSVSSPAYSHALHENHHLFLNLSTAIVYSLPDDKPVHAESLSDIRAALHPQFPHDIFTSLDDTPVSFRLPDNNPRLRGAVAFESLHGHALTAAALHLILRPAAIRNALLQHPLPTTPPHPHPSAAVPAALALACRSLWASHAFRPTVAPHAIHHLLAASKQASAALSANPPDPSALLAWFLNVCAPRKTPTRFPSETMSFASVIRKSFSGSMTETLSLPNSTETNSKKTPFWFLPLDLPPKPLFKHQTDREIVPQVSLESLLTSYNGKVSSHVVKTGATRTRLVTRVAPYLFLVIRRFTYSKFGNEKNPCLVHLPTGHLDLSRIWGQSFGSYRLIAAVSHDGSLEKGTLRVFSYHDASKSWFDVSNVSVEQTLFQLVSLTDTYILLYSRVEDVSS